MVPAPACEHDDVEWSTAARRISVSGDMSVHGSGSDELTIERSAQVTGLVVHLALQPEAVHPNVLAVDGSHFLRADAEGRLSLADEVGCN